MTTAFDPIEFAGHQLDHRIALSPMTRSRAYGPGQSPTAQTATYYSQRAHGGLLITEGIQPSVVGQGYPNTPGLHDEQQVRAWRPVTDAVHAHGGVIFAQLMHTGRIGHPSLLPGDLAPVGASPVAAVGQGFTNDGLQDFVIPVELTEPDIAGTIADFAAAARNALSAGFDGVELHGANGYLLHQFLSTNANQRTDRWGGSVANRIRLTTEVTAAVVDAIGPQRVGLRISPGVPLNDITESDPGRTYPALLDAIDPLGLAYLHLLEGPEADLTPQLRKQFAGTLILNPATPGRPTGPDELRLIADGAADILSYGALFLANPDLPARLAAGGPFNDPDRTTYYGGDEHGYTDYPALAA